MNASSEAISALAAFFNTKANRYVGWAPQAIEAHSRITSL